MYMYCNISSYIFNYCFPGCLKKNCTKLKYENRLNQIEQKSLHEEGEVRYSSSMIDEERDLASGYCFASISKHSVEDRKKEAGAPGRRHEMEITTRDRVSLSRPQSLSRKESKVCVQKMEEKQREIEFILIRIDRSLCNHSGAKQ